MIRAKYWLVSAAFAVVSTMASGCADDYSSLIIVHNQAPDLDTCSTAPNLGDLYRSHGSADVSGGGYFLTPLLQSSLANKTGDLNGGIIQLRGADVRLDPVDSDESRALVESLAELRARSHAFSGAVQPGGLTSTGFDVIDLQQAGVLAQNLQVGQSVEILANIVVRGDVAGSSISTPSFIYPITVTKGSGGTINLGECSTLAAGTMGESSGCFYTGQDGAFVECCTNGAQIICPARATGG